MGFAGVLSELFYAVMVFDCVYN